MIFKIIFTDQKDKLSDFTFISESIDDAIDELDAILDKSKVGKNEAVNRAVLFGIENFVNEDEPEDFLSHVANPDNTKFLKAWLLGPTENYEEEFIEYYNKRSLLDTLSK